MGQALFPPLTTWLIAAVQWRVAYLIVAAVVFCVVVALAFSLRRDPSQMGQLPYGAEGAAISGALGLDDGMTLRQAISTRRFWQYCLAVIVAQLGIGAIVVHAVPHGIDLGMSSSAAAGVVTTYAGAGVAARVVFGGLVDRAGAKRVMASMCLILAASLFGIGLTRSVVALFAFAPLFGIGFGGFVSSMSPLTAQFFGLRSHGAIFGVVTFGAAIGGGVGPLLAGAIFDAQNSYGLAFTIMGLLALVAFMGVMFLKPSRTPIPASS
jgi:MFS family permease